MGANFIYSISYPYLIHGLQTTALNSYRRKKARNSFIYGLTWTSLDCFELFHGGSLNRMLRLTLLFKPL